MESTVAILYIGTGEYIKLWKGFFLSFEKNFLPDTEKEYYVFTDAKEIFEENKLKVHKMYQENLGWPNNALKRYEILLRIEDELRNYQYAFFMNANMYCIRPVYSHEILPEKDELVVVEHLDFVGKNRADFTYERNPCSEAYIPLKEGEVYVYSGVNGGSIDTYLKMLHCLKTRTEEDSRNNITAIWHDESHLNRYIIDYPKYKLLSPSYNYREGACSSYERIIVARNKNRYFNVAAIKNLENGSVEELRNRELQVDKWMQTSYLLRKWIEIKQNKLNLGDYLISQGYCNIVIYGYKNIGELLIGELKQSNVKIKYFIDKNAKQLVNNEYEICLDIKNEETDAIIVTPVDAYFEVYERYIQYTNAPILSIYDVLVSACNWMNR